MVYEDKICIRGLRIFAHHGVYEEETRLGQTFVVNATLYTSTKKGGLEDCLEDTISYADVCQFITDYLQQNTWKLLEAAVEHTCRALLLHYPLSAQSRIGVRKALCTDPASFRQRFGLYNPLLAQGVCGDGFQYGRQTSLSGRCSSGNGCK